MSKIKLTISILFLIQAFTLESFTQNVTKESTTYKNTVTYNLTGIFTREAIIGYERNLNKKNTIRVAVGLKYATSAESYEHKSFLLFGIKNNSKVTKGVYLGVGYNYMLSSYARLYLSAEVYYYPIYYDNIYYQYCAGTSNDSYISLESMREKSKGLKIIFGKKLGVISGNKIGLEFDFFIASGIDLRTQEFTTHEKRKGTCSINAELQVFDPPRVSLSENWIPTMSMGVLIAMPFIKK